MMLSSSLATPYVIYPLLETMGLRSANFIYFGKAIKFWSNCIGGAHFSVNAVTEESLVFDVPECLGKFIFQFVSKVLADGLVGVGVCQ